MKLTKEMMQRIKDFVELNGLYPQPCGATSRSLCQACGISEDSLARWKQKADFAEMLTHAREVFASKTEVTLVNALVKAAQGVDYTREKSEATAQKVVEYDPKTGKKVKEYTTDKLVPKKASRENIYFPPNVEAAKFVLSNIAAERWRLKQDVNLGNTDGKPLALSVSSPEVAEDIRKVIDAGAQPAPPKGEEEE